MSEPSEPVGRLVGDDEPEPTDEPTDEPTETTHTDTGEVSEEN